MKRNFKIRAILFSAITIFGFSVQGFKSNVTLFAQEAKDSVEDFIDESLEYSNQQEDGASTPVRTKAANREKTNKTSKIKESKIIRSGNTTNPLEEANEPASQLDNGFNSIGIESPSENQGTQVEQIPENIASPDPDFGPRIPKILEPNEFGGVPVVIGTRRLMAEGEAPEEYNVETGDTLFDICDQLLDEPSYWPKLWALNPEIKNPHFIYPGMMLRFYSGDLETPPYLQVVVEDDVVPIDKEDIEEEELVREDASALLLELAGPTSTEVIGADEIQVDVESDFIIWGNVYRASSLSVTIPAFIFSEEKEPLGVVTGEVSGRQLSDTGNSIVIEAEDEELSIGSSYTVLRQGDSIYTQEEDEFVGERYDFIAHVNISAKLNEGKYLAKMGLNRLGVRPGDVIVPYISTQRSIPLTDLGDVITGSGNEIIAFELPRKRIGGRGSFVYFETISSADGLSVGQNVAVFQNLRKSAREIFYKDDLPDTLRSVGVVHIIEKTPNAVIGYVVSLSSEIRLGDTAGPD